MLKPQTFQMSSHDLDHVGCFWWMFSQVVTLGPDAAACPRRAPQPSTAQVRHKVASCCRGDVAGSRRTAGEHHLLDELAYLVGKQAKVTDETILAVDFAEAWLAAPDSEC